MELDGKIGSTRTERLRLLLTLHSFSGALPKGLPVSLEILNLSGGSTQFQAHKFTGGIPSEWDALTNLKTLTMVNCSLDGKGSAPWSERFIFATEIDVVFLCRAFAEGAPSVTRSAQLWRLQQQQQQVHWRDPV